MTIGTLRVLSGVSAGAIWWFSGYLAVLSPPRLVGSEL